MEKVIQRKHDRVEKAAMFQKRLCWDYMFKEEFIKVMMLMMEPEEIDQQKKAEEELFKVFEEFDADKSGTIDANELGKVMEKLGRPLDPLQIEDIIMQIDTEGKGEIGWVDFASIFGVRATPIDYAQAMKGDKMNQLSEARAAFRAFDFDKSDSIDIMELDAIMRAMGKRLTEQQLTNMMKSVDKDDSGEIDFKEFCVLLGIEWKDEYQEMIKELDAMTKNQANKRRASVSHEDAPSGEVFLGEEAPGGTAIHQDPSGYTAIKYSPNGRYLGVCCTDCVIRVFELDGYKVKRLHSLREHTHQIMSIDWSPEADRLVSVGADKTLHMWHVKTGQSVQSVKAHSGYVRCVAWTPNGSLIATCSSDKTVKFWNPITLVQTKVLLGHSNWVRWIQFSFDSKRLISGGDDHFIIVWSVPEGQILQRIYGFKKPVSRGTFLNRDEYRIPPILVSSLDCDVKLFLPDTGLHGFMHFSILGVEHMPKGTEEVERFLVFEVGRNRHCLRTHPAGGDSLDFESDVTGHQLSCSVWDMNEMVRVQLFEYRRSEGVKLIGEYSTTHGDLIATNSANGISKRYKLKKPGGNQLTNGNHVTVVKMNVRFEEMVHNANLHVTVEEGKNIKNPDDKGPINTVCSIRTQRGQEYQTDVAMATKTPQWRKEMYFGIGPSTLELTVQTFMVEPSDRSLKELGSNVLRMDKLLSKVCSQQEPLINWYVVRNEDRKSRGSVRLKFSYTEAVKEKSLVPRVLPRLLVLSFGRRASTRCSRRCCSGSATRKDTSSRQGTASGCSGKCKEEPVLLLPS